MNTYYMQEDSKILCDWLRENKDLYKREAMARKLGIPVEALNALLDNKEIRQAYIPRIVDRLNQLLLRNNNVEIKLYVMALVDKFKKLPWLDTRKKQIYDDLVMLQQVFIQQANSLSLFINTEVDNLSKELVSINKEKAAQ